MDTLRIHCLLAALLVGSLAGCDDKGGDDTGPGAETDADTDSDSDTDTDTDIDTDTDTDTDTDPTFSSIGASLVSDDVIRVEEFPTTLDVTGEGLVTESDFTAEIEYVYTYDGATVCDATIEVAGTPFTGDCEGCDFAFDVTGTVTRDDGTADCELSPFRSFVETEVYHDMQLMFWSEYTYSGYDYYGDPFSYYLDNVLVNQFLYNYEGTDYGPYQSFLTFAGDLTSEGATSSYADGVLSWSISGAGYDYVYTMDYQYCGYVDAVSGSENFVQDTSVTSSLDCEGELLDIWEFAATAGATYRIAVDTIAADTAFDSTLLVLDQESCYVIYSDDSFDCTFPPLDYQCSSAEFTAATTGNHQVGVWALGQCTGTTAEYTIDVLQADE